MPHLATDDGINLYYEEVGSGIPIVFVHEFAGDCRSYEPQLRYFGRRYRCIAYNARGYPPSDVPQTVERYSQDRARDDIRCVLDALKIDKAHIVGLSMGGFATVHFGFTYPERARSLVVAGCRISAWPRRPRAMRSGPRACRCRTRIRAAGTSSPRCSRGTRRKARRSPSAACRTAGRRSTTSPTR